MFLTIHTTGTMHMSMYIIDLYMGSNCPNRKEHDITYFFYHARTTVLFSSNSRMNTTPSTYAFYTLIDNDPDKKRAYLLPQVDQNETDWRQYVIKAVQTVPSPKGNHVFTFSPTDYPNMHGQYHHCRIL